MSNRQAYAVAVGVALLLCGCGTATDAGGPTAQSAVQTAAAPASTPTARPAWQPAEDYQFKFRSFCGERNLIGRFSVRVEDGDVVQARGLDDGAVRYIERGEVVPTLADLLAQAETAEADGADLVEVAYSDEGPPASINIDWMREAIDDEACYEISEYSTSG